MVQFKDYLYNVITFTVTINRNEKLFLKQTDGYIFVNFLHPELFIIGFCCECDNTQLLCWIRKPASHAYSGDELLLPEKNV